MNYIVFCYGDEPKSELARDSGDRIQSRNVPLGTSDDCKKIKKFLKTGIFAPKMSLRE